MKINNNNNGIQAALKEALVDKPFKTVFLATLGYGMAQLTMLGLTVGLIVLASVAVTTLFKN